MDQEQGPAALKTNPADPAAGRPSSLHGMLSLFVPGLGQFVARQRARGVSILLAILVLGGLSVWTIAQRARFPEYGASTRVFVFLFLQTSALLVFLLALAYLLRRYALQGAAGEALVRYGLGILYLVAVVISADLIISMAGPEDDLRLVFGMTGVLSAAALSAVWFWQVGDAARVGAEVKRPDPELPSLSTGILYACLLIFVLGWNITEIDLPKAVREYQDTEIILRRIVWPWRSAFEFEVISVETTAKVQAPCPPGATGPAPNEPLPDEAWVVVTPTCGELSSRELASGDLTLGTELTITGGGYQPGATVEILWKNPIGNPFQPRGVGETEIEVDENGEFVTLLNIPEAVIPSTAVGDQIHTLLIRQESGEVFTGNLSREMNLALIGMLETIMLGLMATFFGIILAIPFSFLAARNLMSPIITTLSGLVGGVVLLVPATWAAFQAANRISAQFGGLEEGPLQTAGLLLLLIGLFGYLAWRIGSRLMDEVVTRAPEVVSRIVIALSVGLLGAGLGYLLGIGFSRGVVAIPAGADVAQLGETRYGLAGLALLGGWTLVAAYRRGPHGEVGIGAAVYAIVRTAMNITRSIEPLIWALVGIIWIGPGPFAGTIALTLHTIAALGKLYSESIESIDPGPIEALQATGATRLQTIIYAVVPQVLPPFISFTIYRWDINVRLSTIIGLVGGGGIGFILIQWIRQFQYEPAGIAVWLITITVAVLDFVSSEIRERFV